jgi:hypothetical protein
MICCCWPRATSTNWNDVPASAVTPQRHRQGRRRNTVTHTHPDGIPYSTHDLPPWPLTMNQ